MIPKRPQMLLDDAAVVGNATARTVSFAFRLEEGFAYYPGSNWFNPLWVGGYEFLDPPPAHIFAVSRRLSRAVTWP